MRILLALALSYCLVTAQAEAFPVQVNFTIVRDLSQAPLGDPRELELGSGTFIFDTDVWPSLTGTQTAGGSGAGVL